MDDLEGLDFEPDPAGCECPGCMWHGATKGGCREVANRKLLLHEIHGCNRPDLLDGAAVRLLCEQCCNWHVRRAQELATRAQAVHRRTGGVLVCQVCMRPLLDVDAFLKVEEFSGL